MTACPCRADHAPAAGQKQLHGAVEALAELRAEIGDGLLLLYFPDRKKLRAVLERAKRVGEGFITDPEQWRRLCELEKLVGAGVWTPHGGRPGARRP